MGRLHCTQDPVPEAVRGDMQQLNQLGAQVGLAWTGGGRAQEWADALRRWGLRFVGS